MLSLVIIIFFCSGVVGQQSSSTRNVKFDKQFFGVGFEPYTKFHSNKSDYTIKEVESMLEIVTNRFQSISTYSMGTTPSSTNWDNGEGAGLSPVAASNINKRAQELKLIVNIGTWYNDDSSFQREISNAFSAAEVANTNFPGTVSGIIITTGQTENERKIRTVSRLLSDNNVISRARNLSLRLGVRGKCETLFHVTMHDYAQELIAKLDFIICVVFPISHVPAEEVGRLGGFFLRVRNNFASFNHSRNFTVIGQTGCVINDKNTGKYFPVLSVKFWIEMAKWAKDNQFRIDMFTAFDKPWKTHHFGWWKRVNNDSSGVDAFQEKIDDDFVRYYSIRDIPYVEIEPETYEDQTSQTEKSVLLENSQSYRYAIIFGTLGAIAFIIMVGGILYLYQQLIVIKKQVLSQADIDAFEKGIKSSELATDANMEDALRLPYDRSYEIPRRNLIIDTSCLLGSGNFGCVFKGRVVGHEDDVACKLTQSNASSTTLKGLLSEIKIMIHVGKHPNVVSIVGACTADIRRGMIMIATELCVGGSLENRLRKYKESQQKSSVVQNADCARYVNAPNKNTHVFLPATDDCILEKCMRWSQEIACGMEHIASKNVIHADLATRNVLLTPHGTAKITDFGLSRQLYQYTNYVKRNQEPLPWRWMAIESLTTMTFSTKSDVWSYGVTLFEIFSLGGQPYPGKSWSVDFANELEKGLRMNKPHMATDKIYSKMCDCWNPIPEERPSFTDLASFFQALSESPQHLEEYEDEVREESSYLLQDEV